MKFLVENLESGHSTRNKFSVMSITMLSKPNENAVILVSDLCFMMLDCYSTSSRSSGK